MITFCTKFPPDGHSIFFPENEGDISLEEKGVLDTTHQGENGYCYIAIGVDAEHKRLIISSKSKTFAITYADVDRVYLQPTLPAKGAGMLEVRLHRGSRSFYPDGILWSSRHTDNLHMWLRDIAINISELIGVEFEQTAEYVDC